MLESDRPNNLKLNFMGKKNKSKNSAPPKNKSTTNTGSSDAGKNQTTTHGAQPKADDASLLDDDYTEIKKTELEEFDKDLVKGMAKCGPLKKSCGIRPTSDQVLSDDEEYEVIEKSPDEEYEFIESPRSQTSAKGVEKLDGPEVKKR